MVAKGMGYAINFLLNASNYTKNAITGVSGAFKQLGTQVQQTNVQATNLNNQLVKTQSLWKSVAKGNIATSLASQIISSTRNMVKGFVQTNAEFENLLARLQITTGSAAEAAKAFRDIQKFAMETPSTVDQVTQAYIKMASRGLKPSTSSLRELGDIASVLGTRITGMQGGILQVVEAVSDLVVGQTRRFEELGISVQSMGDKIAFTFNGITTHVKRDSDSIMKYVRGTIGGAFSGAMEEQMKTLAGQFSALTDSAKFFFYSVGRSGINDEMRRTLGIFTEMMTDGQKNAEKFSDALTLGLRGLNTIFQLVTDHARLLSSVLAGIGFAAAVSGFIRLAGAAKLFFTALSVANPMSLIVTNLGILAGTLVYFQDTIRDYFDANRNQLKIAQDTARAFEDQAYSLESLFAKYQNLASLDFKNRFQTDLLTAVSRQLKNLVEGFDASVSGMDRTTQAYAENVRVVQQTLDEMNRVALGKQQEAVDLEVKQLEEQRASLQKQLEELQKIRSGDIVKEVQPVFAMPGVTVLKDVVPEVKEVDREIQNLIQSIADTDYKIQVLSHSLEALPVRTLKELTEEFNNISRAVLKGREGLDIYRGQIISLNDYIAGLSMENKEIADVDFVRRMLEANSPEMWQPVIRNLQEQIKLSSARNDEEREWLDISNKEIQRIKEMGVDVDKLGKKFWEAFGPDAQNVDPQKVLGLFDTYKKGTDDASKAFKELGIDVDDVNKKIADSLGLKTTEPDREAIETFLTYKKGADEAAQAFKRLKTARADQDIRGRIEDLKAEINEMNQIIGTNSREIKIQEEVASKLKGTKGASQEAVEELRKYTEEHARLKKQLDETRKALDFKQQTDENIENLQIQLEALRKVGTGQVLTATEIADVMKLRRQGMDEEANTLEKLLFDIHAAEEAYRDQQKSVEQLQRAEENLSDFLQVTRKDLRERLEEAKLGSEADKEWLDIQRQLTEKLKDAGKDLSAYVGVFQEFKSVLTEIKSTEALNEAVQRYNDTLQNLNDRYDENLALIQQGVKAGSTFAAQVVRLRLEGEAAGKSIEEINQQIEILRDKFERIELKEIAWEMEELKLQTADEARYIGLNARERELLGARIQAEMIYRKRNRAVQQEAVEDIVNEIRKLQELQDAYQTAYNGMRSALVLYQEETNKAADLMEGATLRALDSMADKLTEFVSTGKLQFKEFVKSVVDDLLKIQMQRFVVNPIAGILDSLTPSIAGAFGGIGGASGAAAGGGGTSAGSQGNYQVPGSMSFRSVPNPNMVIPKTTAQTDENIVKWGDIGLNEDNQNQSVIKGLSSMVFKPVVSPVINIDSKIPDESYKASISLMSKLEEETYKQQKQYGEIQPKVEKQIFQKNQIVQKELNQARDAELIKGLTDKSKVLENLYSSLGLFADWADKSVKRMENKYLRPDLGAARKQQTEQEQTLDSMRYYSYDPKVVSRKQPFQLDNREIDASRMGDQMRNYLNPVRGISPVRSTENPVSVSIQQTNTFHINSSDGQVDMRQMELVLKEAENRAVNRVVKELGRGGGRVVRGVERVSEGR